MYTSVMLVAMLGPAAPPVASSAPVRQVVYHSMPGQVVYVIPSSSQSALVRTSITPGTVVYSQPTTVYLSSSPVTTTTYSSPIVNTGAVVRYGTPVYSSPVYSPVYSGGVASYGSPMSYSATVCRT